MTYSCSDFADDIIGTLKVKVPRRFSDAPDKQAQLCIERILGLQRKAKAAAAAIEGLLGCCELNLDDMEEDTHEAIAVARAVLARIKATT
jgi:hypothetical protein